ncbi:MAG: TlpA family protein disulfide reductase [Bacteroidales bacterium]|nr:TlpA family protein disulfide reductase [Bacteroidales bacterium]
MKKFMFLLAAMAVSVTAGAWNYRDFVVDAVQSVEKGKEVTKQVRLSDYVGHGKYILVDFWASWCPPCRGEVPNLKAVYDEFGGDNFEIVSVAVWDKAVDSFEAIAEEGMTWTQIVCSAKTNQVPTRVYGIEGIPYIILIDPDGKVVGDNLRGARIRTAVKKALGL